MENFSYRRFKDGVSAEELLQWLETHNYVYYHAPMDIAPKKVYLTSKVKRWKRDTQRFEFSLESLNGFEPNVRFRIDNDHLDRIRLPFAKWWHGITATVSHQYTLDRGTISFDSRGSLRKHGVWTGSERVPVQIVKTQVVVNQSNGYHLPFDKLEYAINFAKRQNIRLVARYGKRSRVLVQERITSGEIG